MGKISRNTQQARVLALIAGVQKHLLNTSLIVDGTTFTGAQLVQSLQGRVTANAAVVTAKAAWQSAIKTDTDPAAVTFVAQLTQAIRIMYASSVDVLADFGVAPRKVRVVDPATQVEAAAKARATRAARHTLGKNQKKSIKGSVATAAAPATPAEAASTPAAPSPVSPPANGAATTHPTT